MFLFSSIIVPGVNVPLVPVNVVFEYGIHTKGLFFSKYFSIDSYLELAAIIFSTALKASVQPESANV